MSTDSGVCIQLLDDIGCLLSLFFDSRKEASVVAWRCFLAHHGLVKVGLQGVDKKAVGLEVWHWLVSVPSYVL
jgi:hypothetical protein